MNPLNLPRTFARLAGLALLLAWGWDQSDGSPAQAVPMASSDAAAATDDPKTETVN